MKLPTLVFDLDGTLVDTARDLMETLNVILAREGVEPFPVEAAHGLLGAGARALIERGLAAAGKSVSPERMEVLFRDFLAHYGEHLHDNSNPYPGVRDALADFQRKGYRQAVCTNKMQNHSHLLLERLALKPYFAAVAGRDTFPFFKPDPRHLTETILAAGGVATHAIMVGDSRTDADTARHAGLPAILVSFGYTDVPAQTLGAEIVIDHFDDLGDAVQEISSRKGWALPL